MAKLRGGLFGRPSGQLQNLVLGAARDRTGKVATVRELVIPTNPNSADQQVQRGKFHDSLQIVRDIGPSEYQGSWNRAIGQLPGFQSLMSIMINCMSDAYVLTAPPDVPLGTLHAPVTFTVAAGEVSGEIDVTWSIETGSNGTTADTASLWVIYAERDVNLRHEVADWSGVLTRQTANKTITGLTPNKSYLVWLYLEGAGAADGLISPVQFGVATAHA